MSVLSACLELHLGSSVYSIYIVKILQAGDHKEAERIYISASTHGVLGHCKGDMSRA